MFDNGLVVTNYEFTQTKSPAQVISHQQHELKNCTSNNKLAPSWCRDDDGTARFVGDAEADGNGIVHKMHCDWKGFEQCLANKTVLFIGDSRVRHQFMALADFLKAGEWMKCQDCIGLGHLKTQTYPSAFSFTKNLITKPGAKAGRGGSNKLQSF
jgi:hypothetical protein